MDVINQIRRDNGVHTDIMHLLEDSPLANTIHSLKANLRRSLTALSEELYSKPSHFLLEIVQNADDNSYSKEVMPELYVKHSNGQILIECNELGFDEHNVRAICQVGGSTKSKQTGYIGEKGIGFKSVFKVADVVYISSGLADGPLYTFKFDKREDLGMITPEWTTFPMGGTQSHRTRILLELSNNTDRDDLSRKLEEFDPSLILFLRKLRSITIDDSNSCIRIQRQDSTDGIVVLKVIDSGDKERDRHFFSIKRPINMKAKEPKRESVRESEIILAFPLNRNLGPLVEDQNVHAFLPIRRYGFKFVIQGDFLTQSSREGVLTDLAWNKELRDGVAASFCDAVMNEFPNHPSLRYSWFSFLPNGISDPFFKAVETQILSNLQKQSIFETLNYGRQRPSHVFIVPARFLDAGNTALVSDSLLPEDIFYMSPSYPTDPASIAHYLRLGVGELSFSDFLCGLQRTELSSQSEEWHEKICGVLSDEISDRRSRVSVERIKNLRLLPMADGSWSRVSDGEVFFDAEKVAMPDGLGLRLLKRNIGPARRRLFTSLGVKEVDPNEVEKKIRTLHQKIPHANPRPTRNHLIQQAKFLFDQRMKGDGIYVFTSAGNIVLSEVAYMDDGGNSDRVPITTVLKSPPAHFLHPSYTEQVSPLSQNQRAWISWLRDRDGLKINRSPRLQNGCLSYEFTLLTKEVSTKTLLSILKENWQDISGQVKFQSISPRYLDQLSDVDVTCLDGHIRKMKTTAVRNKALASSSRLSFLPIDNPDDESWTFLAKLGVTMSADAMHYCKQLVALQGEKSTAKEDILDTYCQLEARFHDDPDTAQAIRDAFTRKPLIFLNGVWFHRDDTVWRGPLGMTVKHDIERVYPHLGKLFHTGLGIENAPESLLADEIRALTKGLRNKGIPAERKLHLIALLDHIAHAIPEDGPPPLWVKSILGEPIYPVAESSCVENILLTQEDVFYIPDHTEKLSKIFRFDVPILDLSFSQIKRIKPILNLAGERIRYLEAYVKEEVTVSEDADINLQESSLLGQKMKYLKRYISSLKSKRSSDLFGQCQDIAVMDTSSLQSSFSIEFNGNLERSYVKKALVRPKGGDCLIIYINKLINGSTDDIAAELADYVGGDCCVIHSILTMPDYLVEETLRERGIAEMDDRREDVHADRFWWGSVAAPPNLAITTSDKSRRNRTRPNPGGESSKHKNPAASWDIRLRECSASVETAATQSNTEFSSSVIHPTRHSTTSKKRTVHPRYPSGVTSPTSISQPLSRPLSSSVTSASLATRFPSQGIVDNAVAQSSSDTEETDLVGYLGELYVYNRLRSTLDDFSLNNWTSGLRKWYDGHASLDGPSDFWYDDTQGALTSQLFGERDSEWSNHPQYFIEVKSTNGPASQPFHMSDNQVDLARNLAFDLDLQAPEQVYVIFRVSNIHAVPQLKIFVDPHRLLFDGELQIVSSIEAAAI